MMRRWRAPVSGLLGLIVLLSFVILTSRLLIDASAIILQYQQDDAPGHLQDHQQQRLRHTGEPVVLTTHPEISSLARSSKVSLSSQHRQDHRSRYRNRDLYPPAALQRSTERRVTPSLSELGERGVTPESSEHFLMVTRVMGAGAEVLVLILQKLQGFNAFKHIRLPPDDQGQLSVLQQELLVEEITNIMRQEAVPLSFDGDVRFLNFSEFGRQSPAYISMIRDPLDPKILERFRRGDSETIYRGSIAYFCGHDPRCSKRNNLWALKQAKSTVIRWYPVVGILDNMKETLRVLENKFPYFFKDASIIYNKLRPKKNNQFNSTLILKPSSRKRLRSLLKLELEFYEWVKHRLIDELMLHSSNST